MTPTEPTKQQNDLLQALTDYDLVYASMYEMSLELRTRADRATVHLVAHIGRELANAVPRSIAGHRKVDDRDELARRMYAAAMDLPLDDERVNRWARAAGVLVGAAHLSDRGNAPRDPAAVVQAFEELERLLPGLVQTYFRCLDRLDHLIALDEPTAAAADEVLGLTIRPALREYFFLEVTDPAWLGLLAAAGVFGGTPGREELPDGFWRGRPWPEGTYLERIAGEVPEGVAAVLATLPDTDNPVVWRRYLTILQALPEEQAAPLLPKVNGALDRGLGRFFSDRLLDVIARLAQADHEEAWRVTQHLLHATGDEVTPHLIGEREFGRVFPCLADVWHPPLLECLSSLAELDEPRMGSLLLSRFRRIATTSPELRPDTTLSVEHGSPFAALLSFTIDRLSASITNDPTIAAATWSKIGPAGAVLADLIRLELLARCGEHLQPQLDEHFGDTAAMETDSRLGKQRARVLRTSLPATSPPVRAAILSRILDGPSDDEVRTTYGPHEDPAEVRDWWQRRVLRWFDGNVPVELEELADSLGETEPPTFGARELAETGSTASMDAGGVVDDQGSPLSVEEMEAMNQDDVHTFLLEWAPDEEVHGNEFEFGVALRSWAAVDPDRSIQIATKLTEATIPPLNRIAEVLGGVRDALNEKRTCADAAALGRIIEWATGLDPENGADQRTWAVDIVATLCRSNLATEDLITSLMNAIALVLEEGQSVREADVASLEALQLVAMSSLVGRTCEATVELGLWLYRSTEGGDHTEALRGLLDAALDLPDEQRLVAEAAIGRGFPYLLLCAPTWAEEAKESLFDGGPQSPVRRPAWAQYLIHSPPYDRVVDTLRPYYLQAAKITCDGPPFQGDRHSLGERLAFHVTVLSLRGKESWDDPGGLVAQAFDTLTPEHLSKAYWALWRDWEDSAEAPEEEYLHRWIDFWEWRLDELAQAVDHPNLPAEAAALGWFIHTGYMPDHALLTLGAQTASLADGDVETHLDWDRVIELSTKHADQVFEVVRPVLERQAIVNYRRTSEDDVARLFASLCEHGTADTQGGVRALADRLGEAGMLSLRSICPDE